MPVLSIWLHRLHRADQEVKIDLIEQIQSELFWVFRINLRINLSWKYHLFFIFFEAFGYNLYIYKLKLNSYKKTSLIIKLCLLNFSNKLELFK